MGKKRIIEKEEGAAGALKEAAPLAVSGKKATEGLLNIEATFNNTKVSLSDKKGNVLIWSSAGSLGFRGAKKGTPFAASKVGDLVGEKAKGTGMKSVGVVVKGVGSGREPATSKNKRG